MRNPNAVEPTISAVPVSLYRELCHELQAKNGEVNALQLKNQRILDENQQLRQELQRLVQMVMHTHHQVSRIPSADKRLSEEILLEEQFQPTSASRSDTIEKALSAIKPSGSSNNLIAANNLQPRRPAAQAPSKSYTSQILNPPPVREEWITGTHQPLAQRLFQQSATLAQDLRGWRLALIISLIILSAFGAGFLIVRPLLNQQSSPR
jgi:hypothetical protein